MTNPALHGLTVNSSPIILVVERARTVRGVNIMWMDEIVEETRKAREEYAARFDYEVAAIVADVKEQEKQREPSVVTLPPKPPVSAPLAKAS